MPVWLKPSTSVQAKVGHVVVVVDEVVLVVVDGSVVAVVLLVVDGMVVAVVVLVVVDGGWVVDEVVLVVEELMGRVVVLAGEDNTAWKARAS